MTPESGIIALSALAVLATAYDILRPVHRWSNQRKES